MRQTVLGDLHRSLGARMTGFAGWEMPVSYRDIITEHRAVRQRAGIFDLCHMGRVRFRGSQALELAGRVQTSDASALTPGRTRYALICQEDGGILDDILISREEDGLLLVVNAANREVDLELFRRHAEGLDVEIVDDTDREAMVAIQGPRSPEVMEALGLGEARALRYYFRRPLDSTAGRVLVSRTGYTGEVGFEILLPAETARDFWCRALDRGAGAGLRPCGLGARDTLRLEAGMPLYGHEIDSTVNPYEVGLGYAVRSPWAFTGSSALARIREQGPRRQLVGLLTEGPRIPRHGYAVTCRGREVGRVCSGTFSPTLEVNIATALIGRTAARSDAPLEVVVRRHTASATRTPLPFYR